MNSGVPITDLAKDLFLSVARPRSPILTDPVGPVMKMLSHLRSRWITGGVRVCKKWRPLRIWRHLKHRSVKSTYFQNYRGRGSSLPYAMWYALNLQKMYLRHLAPQSPQSNKVVNWILYSHTSVTMSNFCIQGIRIKNWPPYFEKCKRCLISHKMVYLHTLYYLIEVRDDVTVLGGKFLKNQ